MIIQLLAIVVSASSFLLFAILPKVKCTVVNDRSYRGLGLGTTMICFVGTSRISNMYIYIHSLPAVLATCEQIPLLTGTNSNPRPLGTL